MIKVNADELERFSVKLKSKSVETDKNIRKAIQTSCLSIKKNAITNVITDAITISIVKYPFLFNLFIISITYYKYNKKNL